jgi:hypothetical protein
MFFFHTAFRAFHYSLATNWEANLRPLTRPS